MIAAWIMFSGNIFFLRVVGQSAYQMVKQCPKPPPLTAIQCWTASDNHLRQ